MPEVRVSRRALIGGGVRIGLGLALGGAAGCTDDAGAPATQRTRQPTPSASPDPDGPVRARAVADTASLAERYGATLARHPALATTLSPLAAHHQAHLRAFAAPGLPTGSPSPPAPVAAVPPDPRAALAALAAAETRAATARLRDLVTASPTLARLLASVGASQAAHAALLRGQQPDGQR